MIRKVLAHAFERRDAGDAMRGKLRRRTNAAAQQEGSGRPFELSEEEETGIV